MNSDITDSSSLKWGRIAFRSNRSNKKTIYTIGTRLLSAGDGRRYQFIPT